MKKRFASPYEFIWEEAGMLHICHYLTCDEGCECETQHMSPEFLAEFIVRNFPDALNIKYAKNESKEVN